MGERKGKEGGGGTGLSVVPPCDRAKPPHRERNIFALSKLPDLFGRMVPFSRSKSRVFRKCACPAAGNPLYETQNSDFSRRKVADLRQIWRNKRNYAKKIFAQIRRMRRRVRQIYEFARFCAKSRIWRMRRRMREISPKLRQNCTAVLIYGIYLPFSTGRQGSRVVRVADFRIEIPGSNPGPDFFANIFFSHANFFIA